MSNVAYAKKVEPTTQSAGRRRASNDNNPQPTAWQKMQPHQKPNIVSFRVAVRNNITADSLRQVADWQRGARGKIQARDLRALAYDLERSRGW